MNAGPSSSVEEPIAHACSWRPYNSYPGYKPQIHATAPPSGRYRFNRACVQLLAGEPCSECVEVEARSKAAWSRIVYSLAQYARPHESPKPFRRNTCVVRRFRDGKKWSLHEPCPWVPSYARWSIRWRRSASVVIARGRTTNGFRVSSARSLGSCAANAAHGSGSHAVVKNGPLIPSPRPIRSVSRRVCPLLARPEAGDQLVPNGSIRLDGGAKVGLERSAGCSGQLVNVRFTGAEAPE